MSEVTDESARGIEAQIADVLAAHRFTHSTERREWACTAGDWNMSYALSFPERAHRAHLAAALAPLIVTAQADAWDEGATKASPYGGGYLRSFLIDNPYRRIGNELADRVEGGEL